MGRLHNKRGVAARGTHVLTAAAAAAAPVPLTQAATPLSTAPTRPTHLHLFWRDLRRRVAARQAVVAALAVVALVGARALALRAGR